jgi:ATP-dependent Clp protease ATP-binding subunit ClpC
MYERFTDPARKSMQRANQVAQRYRHEYIGTEHILLGIVEEGSGFAVTILKSLNVDLLKIGSEVEKIVQSAPDEVTWGKLPQTPRAKKVIEYAMREARDLSHNYVGTEHLLAGLVREQEGVAGRVLKGFGVRLEEVRQEVGKVTEREPGTPDPRQTENPKSLASSLGRVVGRAARAVRLGRWFGGHSAF